MTAQCEDSPVWRRDQIINAEQLLKQNVRKSSKDVAGQRKALQELTDSLLSPEAHAHCYRSVAFLSSFPVAAAAGAVRHIWLAAGLCPRLAGMTRPRFFTVLSPPSSLFGTVKITRHETCSTKEIRAQPAAARFPPQRRLKARRASRNLHQVPVTGQIRHLNAKPETSGK